MAQDVIKVNTFKAETKDGIVEEKEYTLTGDTHVDDNKIIKTTVTDPATGKLKSIDIEETRVKGGKTFINKYHMGVVGGSFMSFMGGILSTFACGMEPRMQL